MDSLMAGTLVGIGSMVFLVCMIVQMVLTARHIRNEGLGLIPPGEVDTLSIGICCFFSGILWWIIWPVYGIGWLLKKI